VTAGPSQASTTVAPPASAVAGAPDRVGHAYRPQLLTDTGDPAVRDAAALLGPRELAASLRPLPDARAVVLTSDNPNALRDAVAAARGPAWRW
jgi:hypothetical protein